jgi:hypothetical protein
MRYYQELVGKTMLIFGVAIAKWAKTNVAQKSLR